MDHKWTILQLFVSAARVISRNQTKLRAYARAHLQYTGAGTKGTALPRTTLVTCDVFAKFFSRDFTRRR